MKPRPFPIPSLLSVLGVLSVPALLSLPTALRAGEKSLIDTTRSPHAAMYMVDLADVKWNGGLFGERFDVCRDTMVPHLWTIFSDVHESHAWANFQMAAGVGEGRGDGKPHGPPFNDGDFLKWFEALAQVYAVTRDPKIDAHMDEMIAVIAKAQREDGYLHTQKIIPQRRAVAGANKQEFEDREHFETYNMGHLMTTACVHYRITGKTTLLECARKSADYIEKLCREKPAELARNAICPSHYMGVVELYRVTREPRYLELAKQLIEIRSLVTEKDGSDQNQDRIAFRKQLEAAGHAVRANYLYAGVADIVAENGDATLMAPMRAIDKDIAGQKLYITGMTGAIYDAASPDGVDHTKHRFIKTVHQAYGRDYQLPNLTAYNETCATIGYAMWNWRMLTLTGEARYADLFEQSLYNGVLPGISLEGKHYFYVNALKKLQDFTWPLRWSRTRTPNIKASFCCPPNVVRMIAEAHNYVYSLSQDTLWVQLYAASTLDTKWTDGARIRLKQDTDYPWSGDVRFVIEEGPAKEIAVKLRIPAWTKPGAVKVKVNGQLVSEGRAGPLGPPSERTAQRSVPTPGEFFELKRVWKAGDTIELNLNFTPTLWESNPLVEETVDQVAVKYGPLVYCVESNDLPAGVSLKDVAVALRTASPAAFRPARESIAGASVLTFTMPAVVLERAPWKSDELYREVGAPTMKPLELKLVPYYAWGNRGDTEMSVWLPAR